MRNTLRSLQNDLSKLMGKNGLVSFGGGKIGNKFGYKSSYKNYGEGIFAGMALPGISTLGYKAAGGVSSKFKNDRHLAAIDKAPTETETTRALRQKKLGSYIGTGLLIGGSYLTHKLYKKRKAAEKRRKMEEEK